jgi:hypothetical protein
MAFAYVANQIDIKPSLVTQRSTAAAGAINGTAVDLAPYTEGAEVYVNAPVASAADTINFTVQDSEDGSTGWNNIAAAALVNPDTGVAATFTQVTDVVAVSQVLALKTEVLKRYIRVVATTAGASIDVQLAAYVIAQKQSY